MSDLAESYQGFEDLARAQREDQDYRIRVFAREQSNVALIAPHGGGIEGYTSEIAHAIAGSDFNLYLFEGIRPTGNYAALHLTSHRFDEPRCLTLLSHCDHVVAIHGCRGEVPQVFLGGLDESLKRTVGQQLEAAGIETLSAGHRFPAIHPQNICNRGRRRAGVQVEITTALRIQGPREPLCRAIRTALLSLPPVTPSPS